MTGIDICQYQGQYDMPTVKAAGIDFLFLQLTQGLNIINPIDHDQSVKWQATGGKIGYYHFGRPNHSNAKAEAAFFLSQIRNNAIPTADLIPALDVEQIMVNGVEEKVPYNTLEQWINDFCGVLAEGGFPKVILYSNPGYLNANLSAGHSLGNMPLWLSEYAGHASLLPNGWSSWTIWQNSGTGHVNGIIGNVDTDVCNDLSPILLNAAA